MGQLQPHSGLDAECGAVSRERREQGKCDIGKVGDDIVQICCWIARDGKMNRFFQSLSMVTQSFDLLTDDEKLFAILDQGCKHHSILKIHLEDVDCSFNDPSWMMTCVLLLN